MLNFHYNIPTEVFFGKGEINKLGDNIKPFGNRVLLTYGGGSIKKNGIYESVIKELKEKEIYFVELSGIEPNPRISTVRKGVELCREHNLDFILAVGGGSTIDCSKAIAAGVSYEGDPWDFCLWKAQVKNPLPIGAVLTLAATGSEMNGGAVISNEETEEKLPMGHESLKPKFSILDPSYTFSVPRNQTAAGTVDIFVHVIEQYFSPIKNTYLQDRLAEAVFKTCIEFGPKALENPEDYNARANLMWASTLGLNYILTYGKVGDWATHMMEHAVSAVYDITHGVGLAIIAPHWMEYVLSEENLDKFCDYAKNLWNLENDDKFQLAKAGIEKTKEFFTSLGMPSKLSEVGVEKEKLELLAEKSVIFGDIGNFKKLNKEDVYKILQNAY